MKKSFNLTHEVKRLRSFHPNFFPNYDLLIFDSDYTGNVYLLPSKNIMHSTLFANYQGNKFFDSLNSTFNVYYNRNKRGYCIIRDMAQVI